jgi:hypothetical protein
MKKITIASLAISLLVSVQSFRMSWDSYKQAQASLKIEKEKITKTVEENYASFKASLINLPQILEQCQYSECFSIEYRYQMDSSILKDYYTLAGCKEHANKLTDIDRYMEARFVVARTLPIEKKKQLAVIQANYYSVIHEEIDGLNRKKCIMI